MRRFFMVASVGLALGMGSALAQKQQVSPTLPGGASSLQETYQDWNVSCVQQEKAKQCALSQQQLQQNGQRVLGIELVPGAGTVTGTLILPFGLLLDSGVTLQVDDKPANAPLRFRTCLPIGCIIAINFDAPMLANLKAGTSIKVKASADNGQDTNLAISLKGFGTAFERTIALTK